jgi:murein DD-endopeptidase MepM/ murein hydrolase activator NlpD
MRLFSKQILVWAGVIFMIVFFYSCRNKQEKQTEEPTVTAEPELKYGLPVDSFSVVEGTVKSNEYLGQILNKNGVDMGAIDVIARKSQPVFDVRKIKSGNNYTFFLTPDSLRQVKYFVYENSATEYFVYELFDSLRVYRGEKEIEVKRRTAQGKIESSLWNTMTDNQLDPMLALELSDIYAWTIDFFGIQKGDRFRVVYEELFVDSVSIGLGEIYAVQFDHYGKEHFAFRFFQDDRFDYYDETGVSLRRAFRKAPLDFFRISSRFSHGRMHPVLRIRRPHHGVDYAAPKGTPVMSIGDGTVIARAFQAGGGGNYVKIKHNSVYTTSYMHLSGFAQGITPGARVKQGQVIGFVGSTGLSTGPHLDFRVFKNGSPIDPLKMEAPPTKPVKEENMAQYVILKDSLMNELLQIEWQDEQLLADKNQQN